MAIRAVTRRQALTLAAGGRLWAEAPVMWVCPMDAGVRSGTPGRCGKCGMVLVAGVPSLEEYVVRLETTPRAARAGEAISLRFRILHPRTGEPARLETIHEKLLHLFVVSQNLAVFLHEHPERQPDGSFVLRTRLPNAGMYRLLCDFYPTGAMPQTIAKTLILAGDGGASRLIADAAPQRSANLTIAMRTEPAHPVAGRKTMLFFRLDPADGLELYLGARGHLLAASSDLIDLIHTHPALEEDGAQVQFNLIFPRPGVHRMWGQFQRLGVVNTAGFNVDILPG